MGWELSKSERGAILGTFLHTGSSDTSQAEKNHPPPPKHHSLAHIGLPSQKPQQRGERRPCWEAKKQSAHMRLGKGGDPNNTRFPQHFFILLHITRVVIDVNQRQDQSAGPGGGGSKSNRI